MEMLPKAHLTSHSRMSGSRWVVKPSWLPGSWRSFLYSYSLYSCHLFLISATSLSSIQFLSFIVPLFAWIVPMVSLIFLKRSLVLLNLLFSSISLHCSVRKAFFFFSPCLLFFGALHSNGCIFPFLLCFSLRFFSQLPRRMGHGGDFWQAVVHWRREEQTTSVFLPWEPHKQYERQKYRRLKDEFSATGDQWRNNSRKNEGMGPKKKTTPYFGCDDGSKVWCCKEQYCVGTCNIISMNQGKLEMVKEEMARVNIGILGISKLRWTGMGEFNSDDHYIYYCGKESLRRNGVAIIVNKRPKMQYLDATPNRQNDICLSISQNPSFVLTSNSEEAELDQSYEDLQDLLELTPKKGRLECKSRKSRDTKSNRHIWPWSTEWSRANANRVLPRDPTGHDKYPLPTTQEKTLRMYITRWSIPKSDWLYSLQPKMEKFYTVSKNKTGSWLWLRSWTPYCQVQNQIEDGREKPLDHSGMIWIKSLTIIQQKWQINSRN